MINLAPEDLLVLDDRNLSILENEPNGTLVGVFQGIDPNPDHILTYSLFSMEESYHSWEHNDTEDNVSLSIPSVPFQLDPNGTLTSLHPLDYEIDHGKSPSGPGNRPARGIFGKIILYLFLMWWKIGIPMEWKIITTQTMMGMGLRIFTNLLHGFNPMDRWDYPKSPLITTGGAWEENGTLVFGANVRSTGGFRSSNWGYLCTIIPGISLLNYTNHGVPGRIPIPPLLTSLPWSPGRKSSIRPMPKTGGQGEWATRGLLDRWRSSPCQVVGWGMLCWQMDGESPPGFGTYLPNLQNNWIYHLQLGWVYVQADGEDGMWLWMDGEDWLWTKEAVWPFLWSGSSANWLYYIYSSGNSYFYDYSLRDIR